MFWKRKKKDTVMTGIEPIFSPLIPTPPKKQFKNMYDLVMEAERLDNSGELALSKAILKVLIEYTKEYTDCHNNATH